MAYITKDSFALRDAVITRSSFTESLRVMFYLVVVVALQGFLLLPKCVRVCVHPPTQICVRLSCVPFLTSAQSVLYILRLCVFVNAWTPLTVASRLWVF